jgi:hypothetical protein
MKIFAVIVWAYAIGYVVKLFVDRRRHTKLINRLNKYTEN